MVAWLHYANGATPESTGIKGDHLVGDYYVKFNDIHKIQIDDLISQGVPKEDAEKKTPILRSLIQSETKKLKMNTFLNP